MLFKADARELPGRKLQRKFAFMRIVELADAIPEHPVQERFHDPVGFAALMHHGHGEVG